MERGFSDIPMDVIRIIDILASHGELAYTVGGCVRDRIMGCVPKDHDIATTSLPENTVKIFEDENIRVIPTGIKHGTVSVYMNGEVYEITTLRCDGEYLDSRHPSSVEYTRDIIQDLSRRDLTVNAMAQNKDGEIFDPFGGRDDIKNKIIRCVGDPRVRFTEDALRILRALRFASRLGFEIEKDTYSAARELGYKLSDISQERKTSELFGIICSDGADRGVDMIFDLGIQDMLVRGLNKPSMRLDLVPKIPACRMAALLLDSKDAKIEDLKLSNKLCDDIRMLMQKPHFYDSDVCAREIMHVYGPLACDACLLYGEKDMCERVRHQSECGACVNIKDLEINGNDVKAMGYSGKIISLILQDVLRQVIEDPKTDQNSALIKITSEKYKDIK